MAGQGEPPLTIVEMLTLTSAGDDRFHAPLPRYATRPNLFGGQVSAQALRAASMTTESGLVPASMHSYYLRPGALDQPLLMTVHRLRDGRSFAHRRVEASQDGAVVLTLEAGFHRSEIGPSRLHPLPGLAAPDSLPEAEPTGGLPEVPLQVRTTDASAIPSTAGLSLWARSLEPWPDDQGFASCLLVFIADMRTGFASVSGLPEWTGGVLSSLDHNFWFHRPVDPTGWLLVDMDPVANSDARGLVVGRIHDESGVHCATFVQEVLTRPVTT